MARCELREEAGASRARHRRGKTIALVSGKGGVGKTNLALNLGICLARRDCSTILLDADVGLANADILLNASPLADLSDLLDHSGSVEELLTGGPHGLRVVCGVSGVGRRGEPLRLGPRDCRRAVQRLARHCEVLLIDCGAGVSAEVMTFALAADMLMLVTTPEPTALADAYATLKLLCLSGFDARAGVVVNMVRSAAEGQSAARRLVSVAERFLGLHVEYSGHVPVDRHVAQAVRQRVPVTVRYRRCLASTCIDRISRRLLPPAAGPVMSHGIWARVASLFL